MLGVVEHRSPSEVTTVEGFVVDEDDVTDTHRADAEVLEALLNTGAVDMVHHAEDLFQVIGGDFAHIVVVID